MQLEVALSSRFEFARLFPLQCLPGPEIPTSSEAAPRSPSATVLTQEVSRGLPRSDLCYSNLNTVQTHAEG